MMQNSKWKLTDEEKQMLIAAITPELIPLRSKAGISQGELANLIGVSRQTYGAIERGDREMTWNTYLSLVLFYDYNQKTHQMLRAIGAFPREIVARFNDGESEVIDLGLMLGDGMKNIIGRLDEQALRSIRTMILIEYARCTNTPGDVIIKSFDGVGFSGLPNKTEDVKAAKALRAIKERASKNDRP